MGNISFQCWGVREGNEGMDCSINFRPLLRPGDDPKLLCGGETLLLLGEVLMPELGEWFSRRISGISSPETFWNCFSNFH